MEYIEIDCHFVKEKGFSNLLALSIHMTN